MQALLLSPATHFSPDSSTSSPASPATPPPPSLDFLSQLGSSDSPTPSSAAYDTPTKPPPQQSTVREGAAGLPRPDPPTTPSWLTDELDEEWVPEHDTASPEQTPASTLPSTFTFPPSAAASSAGSTTILAPDRTVLPAATPSRPPLEPAYAYASLPKTQPRVPSSLRHAYTASVTSTAASTTDRGDGTRDMSVVDLESADSSVARTHDDDDGEDVQEADASTGSGGTCVYNSVVERDGGAEGQDEGQLAAAVRALRGPNAGLFAAAENGGVDATGAAPTHEQGKTGLLSLFAPPSPPEQPVPLPHSTQPAPSLPAFTFSPPNPVPRTSWKSLPHFSPSPSPPRTDTESTPLARSTRAPLQDAEAYAPQTPTAAAHFAETPRAKEETRPVAAVAPTGPGRRERFLKRSTAGDAVEPPAGATDEGAESSEDVPFVPPPQATGSTTTATSESEGFSDEDEGEEGQSRAGLDGLGLEGPGQPGLGWSSDEDEHSSSFSQEDDVSGGLHIPDGSLSALPSPPSVLAPNAHLDIPITSSPPRLLPSSPARIPLPSPVFSASSSSRKQPPPPSPLRLFQPSYDTVTRQHLAQLVDEIDDLASHRESYLLGGAPAVSSLSPAPGEESEEGFLGDEGEKRSAKRIRLSPRSEFAASTARGQGDLSVLREEDEDENDALALANTPSRSAVRIRASASHRRSVLGASSSSSSRPRFARRSSPSTAVMSSRSARLPSLPPVPSAGGSSPSRATSSAGSPRSPRSPGGTRLATRERFDEANALMERIRRRVEERELRRKAATASNEEQSLAEESPPRPPRLRRAVSTTPPTSPPRDHSPVPLPHLAAAASASIRSALGSPAPSASSSSFAPHAPPPGSPLALGLPPSVKAAKEKGGSLGRRHFARTPLSATKKKGAKGPNSGATALLQQATGASRGLFGSDADDTDADTESTSTAPSRPTKGHARLPSLTTLHPSSADTQRLLASAGASARAKGLVFDQEKGRWIRTPRRSLGASESPLLDALPDASEAAETPIIEEADEEDEEDPFRDFSELRSGNGSTVAPAPSPARADLDALPYAGDGSGSLGRAEGRARTRTRSESGGAGRKDSAVDLSGLGITKGTPPLPPSSAAPAPDPVEHADSPASECHFEPPPAEHRPVDEGAEGPQLVLESEDSATWGRGEGDQKRQEASKLFVGVPKEDVHAAKEKEDDGDELAETSMLGLYAAAHGTAPPDDNGEDDLTAEAPPHATLPADLAGRTVPSTPAPADRSIAHSSRSRIASGPALPRSALKPARALSDPQTATPASGATSTPLRATSEPPRVPRSVSFSDGKTTGKIEGLVPVQTSARPFSGAPFSAGSRLKFELRGASASSSDEFAEGPGSLEFDEAFETQSEEGNEQEDPNRTVTQQSFALHEAPSTRSRKIGAALHDLAQGPEETPFGKHFGRIPPNTSVVISSASTSPLETRPRSRSFTRTHSQQGNATFLTECSFGVSHDRLLQLITDVEPFEPDWEHLASIDLSSKKAESVVRMKEFLPRLDEVNLNTNELSYLTGIPATLRTLLVSMNRLSSLTSFQHLANLERLDISYNQLDSVHQLSCLRHLRELKADGNQIASLDGLAGVDSLVRISLKGNKLDTADFANTSWSRLETLHLSRNALRSVRNVDRLVSLTTLDLDHNELVAFEPEQPMPRLRILRLSSNPISDLDVSFAPKLRTLYVDSARLGGLHGADQLRKLENLSVRDQSGGALTLSMPHIRDVKRLYLSGNPLPLSFPSEKFYNLVYLELAMCQLTSLPDNFASVVPNVRVLTLDYNFVHDLEPLKGMSRLRKLSAVGVRLTKARPVASVLASLTELEAVDLRMNPFTLAYYPPLGPPSDSLLPSHAEHRILHPSSLSSPPSEGPSAAITPTPWATLDTKFRRAMPDEWYHRRAAYRAVVLESSPSLVRLDGLDCTKERGKLKRRVEKLARKVCT